MVVVPVDADENEAQNVYEHARQLVANRVEAHALWRPQFECHDRDDHRHYRVAERLDPRRANLGRESRIVVFVRRGVDHMISPFDTEPKSSRRKTR